MVNDGRGDERLLGRMKGCQGEEAGNRDIEGMKATRRTDKRPGSTWVTCDVVTVGECRGDKGSVLRGNAVFFLQSHQPFISFHYTVLVRCK